MRMSAFAVAAAIACFATPSAAQTACATFRVIGNENQVNYNPYQGPALTTFMVQVTSRESTAQQVRFLLVDDDTKATGGQRLGSDGPAEYQVSLVDDPTRGFASGAAQPELLNSAIVNVSSNKPSMVMFRLFIPAGQQTRAGVHVQDLTVRYRCIAADGAPVNITTDQPTPLRIAAIIPTFVSAHISGSSRGEIDFRNIGANSGNLTRSVNIEALATLPYEVAVDTANRAALRRDPTDKRGIRYSMTYASVGVAPGSRLVCSLPPSPAGRTDVFGVTLDQNDVGAVPAGVYSDTVTLTFMPRDVIGPTTTCDLQP